MHIPVLTRELVESLSPRRGEKYIDATLGEGGHAEEILKRGGFLLGIELDPELLERSQKRLADFERKVLVEGNYRNIREIARKNGFELVSGIYFDLGACLWHFEASGGGFSFHKDEKLNMRYDEKEGSVLTAAEVLNNWSEEEIRNILQNYGEEKYAARIARAIKEERQKEPIETTQDLVKIIKNTVSSNYDQGRIHPARRTFQALRIVVNKELDNLKEGLREAEMLLDKKGSISVISYHSLEDRIVKNFIKDNPRLKSLTANPITPSEQEIRKNPAARSAKMRVAEKKL